jgi:endonuclease-3 related protein
MTPAGVAQAPLPMLADALRPSGCYNVKSLRLKGFVAWLFERFSGEVGAMAAEEWPLLRRELLALPGIGPETADSILLYAVGRPTFVVDAYTRRLLVRLGLAGERSRYEEVRQLFMANLRADVQLFNEYHALVVRHAKERCLSKPRQELCADCILGLGGHCLHPVAPPFLGPIEGFVGLTDQ